MSGIGVNLRVTGHCSQGGRKYMEDKFSVAYQQTVDLKDLEYAFFGIFDGHGGPQAASYAKEHLLDSIVNQRNFWSNDDDEILRAIREGYLATHYAMWKDIGKILNLLIEVMFLAYYVTHNNYSVILILTNLNSIVHTYHHCFIGSGQTECF